MSVTAYHGAVAVSSSAVGVGKTAAEMAVGGWDFAYLTVEGGGVRYRFDGGTPTTSTGHLVPENTPLTIIGQQRMSQLKLIRNGATDVTVRVTLDLLER